MPLDTRQVTTAEGEQRIFYKCYICKGAKNILPYDAKALAHLKKCDCHPDHYQQSIPLIEIPPYNPLENWR